jgi:hypothetical protein
VSLFELHNQPMGVILLFEDVVRKARTVIESAGAPPPLDHPDFYSDIADLTGDHFWDDADEIERQLPSHDMTDPAARSVVAAMLWTLAHPEFMPDEEQHLLPPRMELLERYLSFAPADSVDDLATLRWELHAAAAVQDLKRIVSLGRRAEEIAPDLSENTYVCRLIFLMVNPPSMDHWFPSLWEPRIAASRVRESATKYADVMTLLLATKLGASPTEPGKAPASFTADVLDAIHLCRSWLERAQQRGAAQVEFVPYIQCWCDYAIGMAASDRDMLQRAATGFLRLSQGTSATGVAMEFPSRSAAAHCFTLAGHFGQSEPLVRALLKDSPDDPALWRRLTLCLIKLERISEAAEAFVEYSARQTADSDDLWVSPLVMHLGSQALSHQTIGAAIENAAIFAPARPLGERLMQWYTPWTVSMSALASKKWWVGLYLVGADETHQNVGDGVWEHAIVCFGEAVALELKAKVFIPAGEKHHDVLSVTPDEWRLAFNGRATLGQMIECLLKTRSPQTSAAKVLHEFIEQKFRALDKYVGIKGKDLTKLNELRRRAQHGDLDSKDSAPPPLGKRDAEHVFGIATEVLQRLNPL